MNRLGKYIAIVLALMGGVATAASDKVWLDEIPGKSITSGWETARDRLSVEGNKMKIGSRTFERGIGTHALSVAYFNVDGKALSFEADVGVDSEVAAKEGTVKFMVLADDRVVFESPVMKSGDEPVHVKVDLAGVEIVTLTAEDAGDGIYKDHADWANAFFVMKSGFVPKVGQTKQLGILTPPVSPKPRINGARVYGVRPGRPILWRVPVSGERPMRFTAKGLPAGAKFEAEIGIITGSVAERGEYKIEFTASNAKGTAKRELKLVVGDKIGLTPQMGWCSWNCFARAVTQKNLHDMADAMVKSGLVNHGWSYINVDDFWQNNSEVAKEKNDPTLAGPERTADGTIVPNSRFPDMKGLADYIHSLGLKAGLYSSPGPYTCGKCTGSWGHEWKDAKTYADWGFDYLKYDWCCYDWLADAVVEGAPRLGNVRNTIPYYIMGEALAAQDRDIFYSLCYSDFSVAMWGAFTGGNSWRTAYDIEDTYESMKGVIDRQIELWPYAGPGGWNDPDILILGAVDCGPRDGTLKPTRLTPNEQYTHMSLWAVLSAPLLIGCDLTQLDDFTLSLLTNDEVIETNQDELGAQAAVVAEGPRAQVWAKPMSDGSLVFALYNTHLSKTRITIDFDALGLEGRWLVRDLWRQQDLGVYSRQYSADVLGHATHLVRLFPREGGRLAPGVTDIRMNAFYRRYETKRPMDKPGYKAPKGWPCAECPKMRAK